MIRLVPGLLVSLVMVFAITVAVAEEGATRKPKYPRVFTGKVTDAKGEPIKGARIDYGYFSDRAAKREFVLTDEQGVYRLETKKAGLDYRIGVSAEGYAPQHIDRVIPGPPDKPSKRDFKLTPGARVNLRFVNKAGQPVVGMQIRPTTPSSGFYSSFSSPIPQTPFPGADRMRETDLDGRVTFESLPALPQSPYAKDYPQAKRRPTAWLGLELARKESQGYYQNKVSLEDVVNAGVDKPVEIKLPEHQTEERVYDSSIKGRVVDDLTGKPITDFVVVRRYSTQSEPFHDEQGRFVSGEDKISRGRQVQTRVFADGYAVAVARPVANIKTAVREQEFRLKRHPSFYGRIVDVDGKPIEGVELVTGCERKKGTGYIEWSSLDSYADGHHSLVNVLRLLSDENGEFVVPEMPELPAMLIIKSPGYTRRVILPDQRPKADDERTVEIALEKAATLIVTTDPDSQLGKEGTSVGIRSRSDDQITYMPSNRDLDENGQVIFESMTPGNHSILLYSSNGSSSHPCYSQSVTLKAGEETRVIIGTMFGTLKISGDAAPFSTLRINGKGVEKGASSFVTHADVDGYFELRGLLPAEYTVTTAAAGYSASSGYHGRSRRGGAEKTVQLTKDQHVDMVPRVDKIKLPVKLPSAKK